MGANGLDEYWVPEHVKDYLRKLGFVLLLDDMEPWIRSWDDWMSARGEFYDYRDKDGMGRVYAVHRRSIHPAMRVCKEWGSLLLNEEVKIVCDNQKATDWINAFFSSTNFMNAAQATVVRAFGLGTGAWALWLDLDKRKVRIRHYDARMVIPLSWDEDGISECAFVTRAFYRGKAVDQLQMHLRGGMGFSADFSHLHLSTRTRKLFSPMKARRRTGSSPSASTMRETSSRLRASSQSTTRDALSPPSAS